MGAAAPGSGLRITKMRGIEITVIPAEEPVGVDEGVHRGLARISP
jgi:hypothetical protein